MTHDGDRVVQQARARRLAAVEGGAGGNLPRGEPAGDRGARHRSAPTISAPFAKSDDAAAEDRAEQNREERARFDERVAGDELVARADAAAAARI